MQSNPRRAQASPAAAMASLSLSGCTRIAAPVRAPGPAHRAHPDKAGDVAATIVKREGKDSIASMAVFGVQSAGKSSLLNALYPHLKLKTKKGKCTEGVRVVHNDVERSLQVLDVFGSNDEDIYEAFESVQKIAKLHIALICSDTGYQNIRFITSICVKASVKVILVFTKCDGEGDEMELEEYENFKTFGKQSGCFGTIMVSAIKNYHISELHKKIEEAQASMLK
jgi:predicted GTPase